MDLFTQQTSSTVRCRCLCRWPLLLRGRGDGSLLLFHSSVCSSAEGGGSMDHLSLLTTENRTDRNTCIQTIPLLEQSDWVVFCFNIIACP